ncbi:hypothetical protein [Streptomyces sp. NPDC127084]|uniref:hypothetical protein n=1 Tax=Streptomyces sp. NPDC127084 TaxID=3347133 RepID=UPI00366177F5
MSRTVSGRPAMVSQAWAARAPLVAGADSGRHEADLDGRRPGGHCDPAPETSGVDLARQALLAAREAAKARRTEARQKPKRRTTTVVRDGRAPLAFGTAISPGM